MKTAPENFGGIADLTKYTPEIRGHSISQNLMPVDCLRTCLDHSGIGLAARMEVNSLSVFVAHPSKGGLPSGLALNWCCVLHPPVTSHAFQLQPYRRD